MGKYIDSKTQPIGQVLNNVYSIKVPLFQRSYAWTDTEVTQLWSDIIEAMDEKKDTDYFLGPMVFKSFEGKEENYEIIDGQQRIATIYIILSVIRRILRTSNESGRADLISDYFGKKDIFTMELQSKFQMNEVNDPVFQAHIVGDSDEATLRAAAKTLQKKDSNYLLL